MWEGTRLTPCNQHKSIERCRQWHRICECNLLSSNIFFFFFTPHLLPHHSKILIPGGHGVSFLLHTLMACHVLCLQAPWTFWSWSRQMHWVDWNILAFSQGGAGTKEHTNMPSFLRPLIAPSSFSEGHLCTSRVYRKQGMAWIIRDSKESEEGDYIAKGERSDFYFNRPPAHRIP